jgi:hypothetical protein
LGAVLNPWVQLRMVRVLVGIVRRGTPRVGASEVGVALTVGTRADILLALRVVEC